MAADLFVDPVMGKIIDICFEYLKDQFRWQTGMKEKFERLRENHPKIQAVVFAATQAQIEDRNSNLNKWIWQLRDAIDEADDVLDEFEYMKYKQQVAENNGESKVLCGITSFLFETVRKICQRARKIDPSLKRLEEVVQKLDKVSGDFVTLFYVVDNAKQEQHELQLELHIIRGTGPLPKNDLIGRSKDKEYVLKWLRQPSNEEHETRITTTSFYRNISLLSIVGHGGMGKTTLLQHVYNDVSDEFELKMWVCVSSNFDVNKVIADMLECLKKERPRVETISALQEILKFEVQSKKFLLILDDIWGEEEQDKGKWEGVLAPLACGKLGSKIMVTTRADSVAVMITKVIKKKKETLTLQGLEEDECLQLLNTHAFAGVENPGDHNKLRSITVEIAKKLSGSPLAAKVIGGALSSSLDERYWVTILTSDFRSSEFGQNDILPILRLSYMFLPRHLQNCFAFCCIFPQDHRFDKDDLVRMWIALGFIQSSGNEGETVEDIGGRYFNVLVKKSFFDEFHNSSGTHYKMHDLLHELAQSISAQECFRVVSDEKLHSRIPETIRHLSVDTVNLEILKQIGKFKRLRSLFLRISVGNEEIVDALTKIFQSLRSIRLLYINHDALRLIPEAIGNLAHLRYLKIYCRNENTPLPSSLNNLYHLLFIICDCNLESYLNNFLPSDMNNLFNLRHLKLPWDYIDEIHGIGKLRSLQELNRFSVKNEVGYSIQELEHMNELRQLRIKLLENVKDAEQACKAKLCDKRNLTDLSLEWGDVSYNDEGMREIVNLDLDERVLDNLQPHRSLKILRIHLFMGVRSPIWLNDADLMSNLEYIQLDTCLEWQTLPPFGKLPFLKSLYLINMPKAKNIHYNYYRNEKDCVFPSMELLHIKNLDAMEDLFDPTITDDCLFPCLTKLSLVGCPNLKELSYLPPKLKSLHIYKIGWKTLSCRSISNSIPLEKLFIQECPNITWIYLADKIKRFAALRNLLFDLISLGGHQEVWTTENCRLTLDFLFICDPSMLLMEPLRSIASLKELHITNNNELVSFPSEVEQWFLQVSSSLSEIGFNDLGSLRFLPFSLESLSSLKRLSIFSAPQLQHLPNFPASLEDLYLYYLESLQCLSYLSAISSLKSLYIQGVPLLQQLPDLPSSLKYLQIGGCHEELKKRYNKISGFDRDKLAHIPRVEIS